MASAVRFRRFQQRAGGLDAYAGGLADIVGSMICRGAGEIDHPLLREDETGRDVMLVLTSDRGLCGGYNAAVVKLADERIAQVLRADYEVSVRVVGRRGIRAFRHRALAIDETYTDLSETLGGLPDYERVAKLADTLMDEFLSGDISGIEVAYMQFISSGRQKASIVRILPLGRLFTGQNPLPSQAEPAPYEFMPAADEMIAEMLPQTVRMRLYECFVSAVLAEQAMRVTTMQAATDNADKMIRDLTRDYNRLRQSQITTELAEITSGGGECDEMPRDVGWRLRKAIAAGRDKREVSVTSAVALDESQREALTAAMAEALGEPVALKVQVHPGVLGGLVVQAGDNLYDASIAANLRRVRDKARDQRSEVRSQ